MALMGNRPHAARNKMPIGSGQSSNPRKGDLSPENALLRLKTAPFFQPSSKKTTV